jgi:hypothetical protein
MLEGVSEGSVTSGASVRLCFPLAWQSGTAWPGGGGGCAVMIYGPGPAFCGPRMRLSGLRTGAWQHAPWLLQPGSCITGWAVVLCVVERAKLGLPVGLRAG